MIIALLLVSIIAVIAMMYIIYKVYTGATTQFTRGPQQVPQVLPQRDPQEDFDGEVRMGFARTMIIIFLVVTSTISIIMLAGGYKIGELNFGGVLLGLAIAYLIFSFGKVQNEEKAAMFVFGEPIGVKFKDGTKDDKCGDLKPGLYFAPWGIVEVKKENGTIFQDELPGNPEQIFRQEDKGPVPPGLFPPIRVKFGQPKDPDDPTFDELDRKVINDPYNVPLTVEVVPVVSWHIGSATTFFKRMKTVENCRKILGDKAEGVFGDAFSGVTPARASLSLRKTSQDLENTLKSEVTSDGVVITDAYVKPFRYSHNLNASVENVSIATQDGRSTVISAEAEKQKSLKAGEAIAKNREILLLAEAIGAAELAKVAKLPEGQIALWVQIMSKTLENSEYTVMPGSEAYSAFAGITEVVKRVQSMGGSSK